MDSGGFYTYRRMHKLILSKLVLQMGQLSTNFRTTEAGTSKRIKASREFALIEN